MPTHKLTLANIKEIGGGFIENTIQQAIDRIIEDCEDRPAMKKPRALKLELQFVPVCDERKNLATVDVHAIIDEKLPKTVSARINMRPRGEEGEQRCLVFNSLSLSDINQGTIE